MNINPQIIRQQIDNLKLAFPDLVEDQEAWLLSLESETDLNALLSSIVKQWADDKAMEAGISLRMKELTERRDRYRRRIDSVRALALNVMQAAEIKKHELPEATLSVRNSSPALKGDADPSLLPDDLCNIKREISRSKIRDAIENGRTVEGFYLSNGEPSLTIRIS